MTDSGQRASVENVAASHPTCGQGAAWETITATTSLPDGWGSFCSTPDDMNDAHWYATAPWHVDTLRATLGRSANGLSQVVDAPTWTALHREVSAQVELYEQLRETV